MPLLGRRIREAEEKLLGAKKLILKVKRMGIDTREAEKIYLEAKNNLKNKKIVPTLEGIESARKSVKTAYAKGIKGMLEVKVKRLDDLVKDMKRKNLEFKKIEKDLKKGKSALDGGVKEYKAGYSAVKEGLKQAEAKLSKFNIISGFLATTRNQLRPMEDFNPNITVVIEFRKKFDDIDSDLKSGKIESLENSAKKLKENVEKAYGPFKLAHESIKTFEKNISDARILGATLDFQSEYQKAMDLILKSRFKEASEMAETNTNEISEVLTKYKEAKHEVDMAKDKVDEVKSWGFSAFESEKILNLAQEALKNHNFESAKSMSKECIEKAQNIRDRHKKSLELLHRAKDELEKFKNTGKETKNMENIISEAESEFNRGDYKATMDKLDEVFKAFSLDN